MFDFLALYVKVMFPCVLLLVGRQNADLDKGTDPGVFLSLPLFWRYRVFFDSLVSWGIIVHGLWWL